MNNKEKECFRYEIIHCTCQIVDQGSVKNKSQYSPSSRRDPSLTRPCEVRLAVGDLTSTFHEAQGGVTELELVLAMGIVTCALASKVVDTCY